MTPLDFRNTNSLWGSVLVETLYRLGLRHAVLSPGSRSTPLTVAFARHGGVAATPVLDERSAAFFALGLARRTGRPTALVCTSGTAGANYYPAVIEAKESGVPLLVLTADRPPEMRDCRSGQTIDQLNLYGSRVNFFHECALPEASLPLLRYLRQTLAHAWARAGGADPGPVHLNAPFRDPLPPIADATARGLRRRLRPEVFFAGLETATEERENGGATKCVLPDARRGLIVVGASRPADPLAHAAAIGRLSSALGWPVLADALSPVRNHARLVPHLVTTYDLVPRSPRLARLLRPEFVLCVDGWPTSKQLRGWLQEIDPPVLLVAARRDNADALHLRTRHVRIPVEALAAGLPAVARAGAWAQLWTGVDRRLARDLRRELGRAPDRFEGGIAALLPGMLPRGTPIFVANSMPVRDAEYFWPANDRDHVIHVNRGANGIDGTLSTALGVAHDGPPAVLLTGDLALLHDTNGFLLRPRLRGSLTIVLVNNRGGGIFEHLPIARFEPPFEEFFATPQEPDFRRLAAAYGVPHVAVRSWSHLAALLGRLPRRGLRLLEVRTDRKRDAAFRQALFARVAARAKVPVAG